MAIGAEIAPAHPTPIGTIGVGAEMRGGVHLAAAPPRGHQAWWRGCGCLGARGSAVLTGVAVRLGGEARKGGGLMRALWPWAWGLRCRRPYRSRIAWPHPMKHDAQPHQRDQHQLIEKEMGDHGTTPHTGRAMRGFYPVFR